VHSPGGRFEITEFQYSALITATVISWFDENARDLPWRRTECSPWGVLVSEFMLQQTPVKRVLEPWRRWLERWPTPGALAADAPGEAVREWGRLGYPRRALRLHAAATLIERDHDGIVPADLAELLALPGVGDYTAAAVASFAYGRSHVVLDTNVRRVLARAFTGRAYPSHSPTAAERTLATAVLPVTRAATWAAGSMELGAVVCTAATPECGACPIATWCAWHLAGHPAHDGPPRRGQTYAGTDRQVRGLLLQVLREADCPVPRTRLDPVWPEDAQRERALQSLLADGLAVQHSGRYALPD
jgi:A/G-specific adenine glycosylase